MQAEPFGARIWESSASYWHSGFMTESALYLATMIQCMDDT